MSDAANLDPTQIEQAKRQIRALVVEIAQLSKADLAPEAFFAQFLDRVVSAMAAVGGAVWLVDHNGQLALQYQINFPQIGLADDEAAAKQHAQLLQRTLAGGELALVPARSGGGDEQQAANPTEFLLIVGVLKTDLETTGLIEIFQRSGAGPQAERGYARFVAEMCTLAGEYLTTHQLRHFADRQTLWTQVEDFCHVVHRSLEVRDTAYTIANEGRRLIECDRLSVVIRQGKRCHVEAISGQDVFDRRSNAVRLLEQLATTVLNWGEAVWYGGEGADLPPQVEDALQAYIDESHSKMVAVLPLTPPRDDPDAAAARPSPPDRPLAALLVERIEDRRVPATMQQRAEVVVRHSATALMNVAEHQSLFLMPVWRALGKSRWIVQARTLPKTLLVAAGVFAVVLVLCLWPASFGLESKGTLEPVVRRNVYAAVKGRVADVLVQHGDRVEAGQLLLRMRDSELEMNLTEIEGQQITTHQRVLALERRLLEARDLSVEERNRTSGELAEAREKLQNLDLQSRIAKKKQAELEVRSPTAGEVITWDLENRLKSVPVQRGQLLLQIAEPDGDWELELRMPESRVGYVAAAQDASGPALDVAFQLATDPGETFWGTVSEIHGAAEVHGEEGNTVLVRVAIDKDQLPHLKPGLTVTAQVLCGRRPLGYVWFHDVWAFVETRIVFRYL